MRPKSHAARHGRPDTDPTRVRFGPVSAHELSQQAWVGQRAAAVLPLLSEQILALCERFDPLVVFLGGSAVHGELCGIEDEQGRRIVLSDLDFGVVTTSRIPLEAKDVFAAEVARTSPEGPLARVGFYHREVLGRQAPTMGLVETTRYGFVLAGDSSHLAEFRMPGPSGIPAWEARRLLANRVIEWAASLENGVSACDRLYAAAKLHADAAGVCLVAGGAYHGGGYAARAAALDALDLDESTSGQIRRWTAWRLRPTWGNTPIGSDIRSAADSSALTHGVSQAVRMVLRWITGGESAGIFLKTSPVRGLEWMRSWKRWIGLFPICLMHTARPGGWRRTPRGLLWEAAIEWVLDHRQRAAALLERLTGFGSENQEEIRRQIVRLAHMMDRYTVD